MGIEVAALALGRLHELQTAQSLAMKSGERLASGRCISSLGSLSPTPGGCNGPLRFRGGLDDDD